MGLFPPAMKQRRPKWKLLDHPADIRIEVYGKSLEELFLNAAEGLSKLLTGSIKVSGSRIEKILVLESDSSDDLLVDWLREILFLFNSERFILRKASLKISEGISLESKLFGSILNQSLELEDGLEIKGVTYHGLLLEEGSDGFVAQVIFDI
jgi:SHS2 domain-containing protein